MVAAGTLIRTARSRAQLTQRELAARAGLSQPQIAKLERPDSNPTIDTLTAVLAAAGHELTLTAEEHVSSVDVTQLRERLALSPAERLAAFTASHRSIERLRAGARRLDA